MSTSFVTHSAALIYLTLNCFKPQIRERVGKFEKFIEENDAKRRRAIQKYQTELKLKTQKNRELDILSTELEQLKARCVYSHVLLEYKLLNKNTVINSWF